MQFQNSHYKTSSYSISVLHNVTFQREYVRKNSMSTFWDLRLLPKCTLPANRDQIAASLTHAFIYQIPQSRESKTYSLTVVCQAVQWPSTLVIVVQLPSCVQLLMTPWSAARQASLSFTVSQSLLKLMSIELVMPSNHLIFFSPFSCPQSFLASGYFPMSQLFESGGQSIGASASASSPSNKYSGPINIQGWFPLGLTGLIFL